MSDDQEIQSGDQEIQSDVTNGIDMDEAFCARMRMAIAAGLECPPIGVITTPGTKNPRYVATEPSPLASPLGSMEF
jgi:hypothetical protein